VAGLFQLDVPANHVLDGTAGTGEAGWRGGAVVFGGLAVGVFGRGRVRPSERYRLCYCRAFEIPVDDFGMGQTSDVLYQITISAADVVGLLNDLRSIQSS
jgi:hypothetical protein